MGMVRLHSATVLGVQALPVVVEVTRRGSREMGMVIVGLADTAVKESRERVHAALQHARFAMSPETTLVNLAPADLRKEGAGFDLPIALAVLGADGVICPDAFDGCVVVGELGLDGSVRPVRGVLPVVVDLKQEGFRRFFLPRANLAEAAAVEAVEVYGVGHLLEAVAHFRGDRRIPPASWRDVRGAETGFEEEPDLRDVRGHRYAKRALEVAAAGGHNILMIGPPGSGKTLLARRLPSILPSMTREEAIEATRIHSVAGLANGVGLLRRRPFRSPHHTISHAGLVGGGSVPRPGEISLAHHGVLFLDELPEFQRSVLEVLRQPLENGTVTVARAAVTLTFPARFMLVAAMNPCPCGYYGAGGDRCRCTPGMILRYRRKLSGPLLDRLDMHLEIPSVPPEEMRTGEPGEPSAVVRERVEAARERQRRRYRGTSIRCNAELDAGRLERFLDIEPKAVRLLEAVIRHRRWSARVYHRMLKLARTVADLEGSERVRTPHVAEAVQYRAAGPGTPGDWI